VLARYPNLGETLDVEPRQRTQWNVRDSDATLVLLPADTTSPGTTLTIECANRYGKPLLVIDPDAADAVAAIRSFLMTNEVRTLNIAGPRESESPGIYAAVGSILTQLLSQHGRA